ncbi:MAG: ABC transporter ATP-binding protein [Nitrospinae bacterium]|nr:ABC transporter ATP-binding protein [Nitrospinota bacterium]
MSEAVKFNQVTKYFRKKITKKRKDTDSLRQRFRRFISGQKIMFAAVKDLSFSVREGEVFGILGPNGAGKSTLMRLIATLLLPDEGSIEVFGHDVIKEPLKVQRLINWISEACGFFDELTTMDNLIYTARLYGLNINQAKRKIWDILDYLSFPEDKIKEPVRTLSSGLYQKVFLVKVFLTSPRLVLLDEPTLGLDLPSRLKLNSLIKKIQKSQGTTIILSTHNMELAELCDRIAFLDKGQIVALDTQSNLKNLVKKRKEEVQIEDIFFEVTGITREKWEEEEWE